MISEIKKGIANYVHEQNVLLRLIRKSKGLTETEFDRIFKGREHRKPIRFRFFDRDSTILGVGRNGGTEWAWQLELLQCMLDIGLVSSTRNANNEIVYGIK